MSTKKTPENTNVTQVLVAFIAALGVIVGAAFANFDKIFPPPKPGPIIQQSTLNNRGQTTILNPKKPRTFIAQKTIESSRQIYREKLTTLQSSAHAASRAYEMIC